jgi:hypothetical protein
MNSRHFAHVRGKRAGVIIVAEETIISGNASRVTSATFHFRQWREITLEMRWTVCTGRIRRIRGLKVRAVL